MKNFYNNDMVEGIMAISKITSLVDAAQKKHPELTRNQIKDLIVDKLTDIETNNTTDAAIWTSTWNKLYEVVKLA